MRTEIQGEMLRRRISGIQIAYRSSLSSFICQEQRIHSYQVWRADSESSLKKGWFWLPLGSKPVHQASRCLEGKLERIALTFKTSSVTWVFAYWSTH